MTPIQTVSNLLSAHTPADDSEAASLRRIRELVASASAPFSRNEFTPGHLTASAIVVNPERTMTLLILHAKLERWLQPGGHFEPGESDPDIASAREAREETGLLARWPGNHPVLLDVDVHTIPARKSEPQHSHFDLRMLLVAAGQPTAGEVAAAKWVRPDEFEALNLDPGLQRALKKIRFSL